MVKKKETVDRFRGNFVETLSVFWEKFSAIIFENR